MISFMIQALAGLALYKTNSRMLIEMTLASKASQKNDRTKQVLKKLAKTCKNILFI
jgi:hypothetical protein